MHILVDGCLSKVAAVSEVRQTVGVGIVVENIEERVVEVVVLAAKYRRKWLACRMEGQKHETETLRTLKLH